MKRQVQQPQGRPKIIVTLPAYNAGKTLRKTYNDIPKGWVDEILLVDDASYDHTVAVSRKLGLWTIVHPDNRGYGGNLKTCFDFALGADAEIIIILHPDYQYEPRRIPELLTPILRGEADLTFGTRFSENPLAQGMPLYRYIGNRALTWCQNTILGTSFSELHSGFKAYTRRVLEAVPYHRYSDQFTFESQITIDAILKGFRLIEVSIPTRYDEESSSANIFSLIRYVLSTLLILLHKKYLGRGRLKVQCRKTA